MQRLCRRPLPYGWRRVRWMEEGWRRLVSTIESFPFWTSEMRLPMLMATTSTPSNTGRRQQRQCLWRWRWGRRTDSRFCSYKGLAVNHCWTGLDWTREVLLACVDDLWTNKNFHGDLHRHIANTYITSCGDLWSRADGSSWQQQPGEWAESTQEQELL